ncbi:DNA alkylation repair protein [Scatolibacter rhodanostii]|uniref:DNA alkylation repair protein n=1 Tax=Scatolibacter rhodanostii TaxID=2014781 RepID=UPI000C08991B|nr:DNA alkylation repair protein [Scatolibacter rhodanostii]
MQKKIKQELEALAEEKYRSFSSALLPGTKHILGVRLPLLRKLSKKLAQSDWQAYLLTAQNDSFEEIMLQGMVIGCINCSVEERLLLVQKFIPKIDNWSVCDSFCAGLKFTKKSQAQVWDFLKPYLKSDQEFQIRFAVVMLLFYYIDKPHIHAVLTHFDEIHHEGYYAKMAVAWAISICYIQFPEYTLDYLKHNRLDDFTYNKALQKITESLKIDYETKKKIRAMKRKL